jgi:hypothetical protein
MSQLKPGQLVTLLPQFSVRHAVSLAIASGFSGALAVQSGCSTCKDVFEIHVVANVRVGAGGCEMALENAGHVARYAFTEGPYADAALQSGAASTSCEVVSGPPFAPPPCFYNGEVWLNLLGDDAHALVDFLGSQSFQVTVTCDGTVVKQESGSVQTQMCAD